MSDSTNILRNVSSLEAPDQLTGYSKVVIYAGVNDDGEDVIFTAGDDSGMVLEIKNDFGTQQMADNVLARIKGFQYQPFEAQGAHIDPAAEIGDGLTVGGIYSGVYIRATKFGALTTADLSAPTEEEIEHEFTVEGSKDREYVRFIKSTKASLKITNQAIQAEVEARTEAEEELRATLLVQAGQIDAKVSKTGGSSSSFGWTLEDDHWSVYSNSTEVLKVTSSGAEVKGVIKATSGYIGSETDGFNISSRAIYKNISEYGGTQSTGVYIGTNGIQLGQGFKVDSSGNLYANNGTFNGNVNAKNIQYGGNAGYFSGGGISGGSITTAQTSGGINSSLGFANFSNDVFNSGTFCKYMNCDYFSCRNSFQADRIYANSAYGIFNNGTLRTLTWRSKQVVTNVTVNNGTITCLTGGYLRTTAAGGYAFVVI